jgi:NAD(P)-dependent dehydrogenase (short-subunit alcohol dehydrogenase family)
MGQAPRNYYPENGDGKTVIVTGATTGIGHAVAKLLVERGARVLIFGRDENDLQDALTDIGASGEVHGLSADQSKIEDIRRVFAEADGKLGGLDILVNNAAISAESITEAGLEEIQYSINSNLFGPVACAREALQRMKLNGKGHIVNRCSWCFRAQYI